MAGHECPANGCTEQVSRSKLACPRHWRRVSPETSRRVYAAYRQEPLGEAHMAAIADAIEEINR